MRLGVYDDSLLLVGARLSGAGWLPYRDFYTHYGPLGFAALAPVLRWLVNPGLTLRVSQSAGLIGLAVLFGLAARRSGARLSGLAFPAAAAALSPAFAVPAFLGFGFAAGAVALFLCGESESGPRPRGGWPWTVAAGALLAAGALTRPAFAAYVAAAIAAVELAVFGRASIRRLLVGLAAAAAVALILWAVLFRNIDLREALVAVTIAPARLMARRHLDPGLARESLALTLPIAAAIAAAPLLWAFAAPPREGRRPWIAACAIAAGAAAPLLLRRPVSGVPATVLAGVAFAASVLLAWLSRDALGSSPSLRAAAMLGASAAAFGHYFWSRPDVQHLYPLVGLSAVSAALAWEHFGRGLRALTAAALLLAFFPIDPGPGFPGANLFRGGIASIRENAARPGARLKTIWPAGEVPSAPVEAVRLADRLADRRSRFVAYGNDQSWTPGDPVFLFLLSSRLPYTRWFQYDPDLQSSAPIQQAMIRELEASGSRSAVVWRSESYYFDPPPPRAAVRSRFDAYVDRVYGNVVARFGSYEVRTRD